MPQTSKPIVRTWKKDDIPGIIECYKAAYPEYATVIRKEQRFYEMELETFPEGQFLVELDGQVIGYATSLMVQLDDDAETYTYREITGADTFSTHDPSGDTLYGADIAVHPDHRGKGIASLLYKKRKQIVTRNNLRRMLAYGRIPQYNKYSGKLTAEEYVQKVVAGEIKDFALNAHLKAGYKVKKVLLDLVPDESSLGHSTLIEWLNPKFNEQKRRIASPPLKRTVRKVRVCCAQYLMRRISTWSEFENTCEFFVETADSYHSHFLLFPELFTAHLFSTMSEKLNPTEEMFKLAEMENRYIEMFTKFAKDRSMYIIGGSHPVLRDGELFNVAHMFTPSGKVVTQDKLHITPAEREDWNFKPGTNIKVFDTSYGRIAILICYDVEFPEAARLLALSGVEILFVPFATDVKSGYMRVKTCAHARAIENYYYVALSGNVGSIPTIKNYLINYGQAAVLTPSDHAFPPEAIAGIADPNVETVVIAELDLTSLAQQREVGSVRPYFDRRPDLYDLTATQPIEIIKAY